MHCLVIFWYPLCLDLRSQMTQQVLNNPEMLRQALDNPLVQSMTSNPELMRSIMMSNPEMQNLMEVRQPHSHNTLSDKISAEKIFWRTKLFGGQNFLQQVIFSAVLSAKMLSDKVKHGSNAWLKCFLKMVIQFFHLNYFSHFSQKKVHGLNPPPLFYRGYTLDTRINLFHPLVPGNSNHEVFLIIIVENHCFVIIF